MPFTQRLFGRWRIMWDERLQRRAVVVTVLACILFFGLVLRLRLSHLQGYSYDVGTNQGWAKSAAQLGVGTSYQRQIAGAMMPNYPPFSLIIFAVTGHLYQWFVSPLYNSALPAYGVFIKLPAILFDLLTCFVLYLHIRSWRGVGAGLLAAAVYAFHPAVFYDSAVWGQTDSIFTFFIVAALACMHRRMWLAGVVLLSLAVLTKAQAVIFLVFFAFVLLPRPRLLIQCACLSLLTVVTVLMPFIQTRSLLNVLNVYTHSIGFYHTVSFGAYNFWWSLLADEAGSRQDSALLFHVMSYRSAGLLIFTSIFFFILLAFRRQLWHSVRKRTAGDLYFLVCALIAGAFFLFNTEMHERYLFPMMALALPLLFLSWEGAWIYLLISLCFFGNLLGVLPFGAVDKALFNVFPAFDVFIACAQFFLFVLLLFVLIRSKKELIVPLPMAKRMH